MYFELKTLDARGAPRELGQGYVSLKQVLTSGSEHRNASVSLQ